MRCKKCKKKISEFAKECPYCHTESTDQEKQVVRYLEKVNNMMEKEERDRARFAKTDKKKQKRCTCIAGAVVLAIITVGGKVYQKQHNEWPLDENRITYLTGDTLITQNLETNVKMTLNTFDLSDFYNGYKTEIISTEQVVYHESAEKKCIFYTNRMRHSYGGLNEGVMLYEKDTTSMYSKPKLIEEAIQSVVYDKEGNVYYIPTTEQSIIKYDGTKKEIINFPNACMLKYNENRNEIFVQAYNDKGDSDSVLSVISLSDLSIHRICEFMDWNIIYSEDGESVYYLDKNMLYRYDSITGNTELIANNVSAYQLEDNRLYYIQYELEKHSYYDFVKDPYLQEDSQAKGIENEDKDYPIRKEKREQLKNTSLYTPTTILYCYEDGEYREVERNIGCLYNWGEDTSQSVSGITICKQAEVTVKYELTEFGMEQIDDINEFYASSNTYVDENDEVVFYEWYDTNQINGQNLPCVVIMANKMDQESLQDSRIQTTEVEERRKEHYTRSANGITCYYDPKNEMLVRIGTDQEEKVIAEDVFSFCILKDGTILVMAGDGEDTNYDLYEIGQAGTKKKIAENVWGMFGEDIYQVSDYNQIEERE